jgi:ATP-dependent RNA helicase RhlE
MASYSYKSRNTRQRAYHASPGRGGRSGGGGGRGPKKQYIDPSRFVQVARPVAEMVYDSKHTFADFAAEQLIKDNLAAKGYVDPSPIQDQTIPLGLEGRDIIGIANTGTGKTAAFAVPILHKLMNGIGQRALIIAPTRELAQQIEQECKSIARGSGLTGALLIGGSPMPPQLRDLKNRPNIVIGTPGRIKDHIERGTLRLQEFTMVVLDEVDRMLDMGFINDVRFILDSLAPVRQSFFFSATLEGNVRPLIETFANDPVTVSIKSGATSENVHQDIIKYRSTNEKLDQLHDVLNQDIVDKVIIFDERQRDVEKLSNELISRGFKADAIHGGKNQGQRQRALRRFKENEVKILVATDVAARGIDVADITHVINYTTPKSYDDYVHRIGRAGRAGRVGYALTFVN